jgi:hypothetical protein
LIDPVVKEHAPTFSRITTSGNPFPAGGWTELTQVDASVYPAALPPPYRSMGFKYPMIVQGNHTEVMKCQQGML